MRFGSVCGVALLLAGCSSGGGSSPTPTPPPVNQAPTFTSATTATLVENLTAAYQAAAIDPNGDPVTFTIAGGADAADFAITAAGALAFAPAPNFDAPGDADADNVYRVQLRASDGALSSTLDLAVTVTNSREGIRVRRVATGFDQPVHVAAIPGNTRVFVLEKTGGIWTLDPATGARSLLFRETDISTDGERGMLAIAAHPAEANPLTDFFTLHTETGGAIEVRYRHMPSPTVIFYNRLLQIPHPTFNNHNGGWLGFGPDGKLYVTIGDGGGAGDPGNNAQNPNSRLGKVLRLIANPAPLPPAQPWIADPANPYAGGGGDPFVFAIGLRNPFRASFGPDGRLYIGDVGQGAIEEVDVLRPDQPGLNFGWRFREGTQPFSGTPPAGLTLTEPVTQYAHGTGPTQGRTVIGGHVYRGPIASLMGSYVFGDFISRNLWTVPAASLVQGTLFPAASYERRNLDFAPDVGTIDQLVSFGEDSANNLYIVDMDGEIFVIEPG